MSAMGSPDRRAGIRRQADLAGELTGLVGELTGAGAAVRSLDEIEQQIIRIGAALNYRSYAVGRRCAGRLWGMRRWFPCCTR
jgi:hypothetical protein